ncbi:MAG: hypothetical protein V4732_13265 [Pseudomonadota bacterium]
MNKESYQIDHSWGDPREPEYKNGYLVISVYYKEEGFQAGFRVYASNESSNGIDWILEAPVCLRKSLGSSWARRTIVFDRVVSYLKQIDRSDNWRIMQNKFFDAPEKNLFTNIVVDTSKVKSWLKTRLEALDTKLLPVTYTLPSKNTFPPLAIGFILAYLTKINSANLVSNTALIISFKILAGSAIVLLIRDIANNYKMLSNVFVLGVIKNPSFNWRRKAVTETIKHFGRRYVVTFFLAMFLLTFTN